MKIKIFMKLFIILLIYTQLPIISYGQARNKISNDSSITSSEWGKNKIGFTYSMMTGYGMSYWREINEEIAFKTQIFGYGSTEVNNKFNNSLIASFGIELQYNLKKIEKTRLYLLSGGYYGYSKEFNYYIMRVGYIDEYKEYLSNLGVGFGFEVLALKNLSFSIDGGYFIGFKNVQEFYENENLTIYKKPFSFGFGLGISAFYNL